MTDWNAMMSGLAALGAFVASGVALYLAKSQEKRESKQREAIATALAPGMMFELCCAEVDADTLSGIARGAVARESPDFATQYAGHLLRRTYLLETIVPSIAVFGDAGACLASATASIADLRAAADAWKISLEATLAPVLRRQQAQGLGILEASARDCAAKVGQAIDALERRGVPVPPEIIRPGYRGKVIP